MCRYLSNYITVEIIVHKLKCGINLVGYGYGYGIGDMDMGDMGEGTKYGEGFQLWWYKTYFSQETHTHHTINTHTVSFCYQWISLPMLIMSNQCCIFKVELYIT